MKRRSKMALLALAMMVAMPLCAQDDPAQDKPKAQDAQADADPAAAMSPEAKAMMEAWMKASTPGPQHKQLAGHFVGNWNTRQTMWMDPAAPPMKESGKSVATMFGDRHVRETFDSRWMGQPFQGLATTSYDNVTGKYVNSWVDSMSTGQFISEGDYDPATRTYTFRGEMADPMKPGTMIPMRTTVRVVSDDEHVMEMHETRDGKEFKSMEIVYTRAE